MSVKPDFVIKDYKDRKTYPIESLDTGIAILLKIFGIEVNGEEEVNDRIEEVKRDGRESADTRSKS